MGRKIGAPRDLQFGDVALKVKVTWGAWHDLQDAVKALSASDDADAQERDRAEVDAALEFCKSCVVGWDVLDEDGKPLDYSPDLLVDVFAPSEIVLLQNRLAMPADELLPNARNARGG